MNKNILDLNRLLIKLLTTSLLILWSIVGCHSQEAQFSQFYVSSLYLNPALAGQEGQMTFISNYRTQWRSIINPFVSNQLSFIYPLKTKEMFHNHKGGLGASVFSDRAGDGSLRTNGFNVTAAYNLELAESSYHFFAFGLHLGFMQKSIDFTNLQWGVQYNPYLGFDANIAPNENNVITTKLYPDVAAGMMWYYNGSKDYSESNLSAFMGVSGYHLNQPNESLIKNQPSKLPILLRVHGGLEYKIGERMFVGPNFLYANQKQASQINAGLYLAFKMIDKQDGMFANGKFSLGGWYRLGDAYIASAGFLTNYYQLGFSYDINSSNLRYATGGRGAYEISLVLRKIKDQKLKRFSTPRI